jgi:hypothetical protein
MRSVDAPLGLGRQAVRVVLASRSRSNPSYGGESFNSPFNALEGKRGKKGTQLFSHPPFPLAIRGRKELGSLFRPTLIKAIPSRAYAAVPDMVGQKGRRAKNRRGKRTPRRGSPGTKGHRGGNLSGKSGLRQKSP